MSSRANQRSFFDKSKLERNWVRGQTWERVLLSSQDPLGVVDQVHRENQGDQSTPDCVEDAPGRKFSGWDHCSINTTFFDFLKNWEILRLYLSVCQKTKAVIPKMKTTHQKAQRYMAHPVKSHLVWKANRVRARHRAAVMAIAIQTHSVWWKTAREITNFKTCVCFIDY